MMENELNSIQQPTCKSFADDGEIHVNTVRLCLCLFPKADLDGFAANLICRAGNIGAKTIVIEGALYGHAVEPAEGEKDVIIVGDLYRFEDIVTLCRVSTSVTHLVKADDYRKLYLEVPGRSNLIPHNLRIVTKEGRSLIGIAFGHFFGGLNLPWHYKAIENHTLGIMDDPDDQYVVNTFRSAEMSATAWAKLYLYGDCPTAARNHAIKIGRCND